MLPIYRASARSAKHLACGARLLSNASGDYLQNAKIPTYHFQDSLPRLPIPDIKDTAERYLLASKPLLTDAEFATTQKAMHAFAAGIGKELHESIVARDKTRYSSYISEPWFDMYLSNRQELPLNINPQLTFKNDPAKTTASSRAAAIIVSSCRFYKTLNDLKLEPDMFHTQACMGGTGTGFFKFLNGKGGSDQFNTFCSMLPKKYAFYGAYLYGTYPLDMSQYSGLFNSTRVPGLTKDVLVKAKGRHVIIQYGSAFYKLDVMNPDGSIIPASQLQHALDAILSKKPSYDALPVGILTTMNRTEWAKARDLLVQTQVNQASIADIDSALFAVCLEETLPTDPDQTKALIQQQNLMLYGGDAKNRGRNRWFDKSFQLIVMSNGVAAINFEHSWGDGVSVLRYFNEVCQDAEASPLPTSTSAHPSGPQQLKFEIPAAVAATIAQAEKSYDGVCDTVDHHLLEVPNFNAKYIKSKGLGLDGVLQMTFQLAHYNMYGESASTYESANQSAYKHGRTETIRSCTVDSHEMCKVFVDNGGAASNSEKVAALTKAVKTHGNNTKNALMGKGFDRHIFAMKYEALNKGLPLPDLYKDKSYETLSEIILSTSTLSSPNLSGGGFGPVGPRCYGIGYTTGALPSGVDGFGVAVMSYKRDTVSFVNALEKGVKQVAQALGPMDKDK